ncbi:MAG: hypothetical protein ACOCVR_04445 [Myxococcota bacterium]
MKRQGKQKLYAGGWTMLAVMGLSLLAAGSADRPAPERGPDGRARLLFPTGDVRTVNIIEWDANALPPVYERSDQLPLTDEEVLRLAGSELPTDMIVKMIEERRCACDASADALVRLSEQGVANEIVAAVSTHALRPNRHLRLAVTLDFDGASRTVRQRYLYLFVEDGDITRVFSADLGALLGTERAHETMVDRSDLLISRTIRRIQLAGRVPLKTYGRRQVLVATSANPAISHPSQLSEQELADSQSYTIDYPRSSITNICRLHVGYRRDVMLEHRWHFAGSRFECEWN